MAVGGKRGNRDGPHISVNHRGIISWALPPPPPPPPPPLPPPPSWPGSGSVGSGGSGSGRVLGHAATTLEANAGHAPSISLNNKQQEFIGSNPPPPPPPPPPPRRQRLKGTVPLLFFSFFSLLCAPGFSFTIPCFPPFQIKNRNNSFVVVVVVVVLEARSCVEAAGKSRKGEERSLKAILLRFVCRKTRGEWEGPLDSDHFQESCQESFWLDSVVRPPPSEINSSSRIWSWSPGSILLTGNCSIILSLPGNAVFDGFPPPPSPHLFLLLSFFFKIETSGGMGWGWRGGKGKGRAWPVS